MHILEVQNLTKTFKKVTAADHVSFHVQEGELFGLLGTSIHPPLLDFTVLAAICAGMVTLGSILFETSDVGQ